MGSPAPTELFKQLTGSTGITHVEGTAADAEHTMLERCVWITDTFAVVPIAYQPDENAEAVAARAETFDVSIYVGTIDRLREVFNDLVAWVDMLCGPPNGGPDGGDGYSIATSKPGPRSNDPAVTGWGMVAKITLKYPIFRRYYATQVVTGTSLVVEGTGPAGANPGEVVSRG